MGEAAPPEDRLKRHDLTDVEWARLGLLLPGHPRQGHRSATLFHDLRDTL
jgi:transposase